MMCADGRLERVVLFFDVEYCVAVFRACLLFVDQISLCESTMAEEISVAERGKCYILAVVVVVGL